MSTFELPKGYTKNWSLSGVRRKFNGMEGHSILAGADQVNIAAVWYDPRQHIACFADAKLIALAPAMAAEIRRLEAENARLREAISKLAKEAVGFSCRPTRPSGVTP